MIDCCAPLVCCWPQLIAILIAIIITIMWGFFMPIEDDKNDK